MPQGFNRYSYTQNDPVNFVDPSGLVRIIEWGLACVGVNGGPQTCERYIISIIDLPDPIIGGDLRGIRPDPQNPAPTPDPAEIERLIKSCAINISIVPEDIYNAIRDNKRDVQSLALSLAHAATESGFLPGAVGAQQEIGLFQIKQSTANDLGLGTFTRQQLFDPALNTRVATTHLQNLINSFNGDVRTALGAYKQGERGVRVNGLTQKSQEYADGILGCERAIQRGRR